MLLASIWLLCFSLRFYKPSLYKVCRIYWFVIYRLRESQIWLGTKVLYKKVFLKTSQNSLEIPFNFKDSLRHRCFPVSFMKFFRTSFYRTLLEECFYGNFLSNLKYIKTTQRHLQWQYCLQIWITKTFQMFLLYCEYAF